jgi:hypothetical protein
MHSYQAILVGGLYPSLLKGEKMKNYMRFFVLILAFIILVISLTGCVTANSKEAKQVNLQQEQYVNAQPAPQFTWSLTRHELIEIYKAKNAAVSTYSVVYNQYKGIIEFQCASFGYPIPGGTELTNSMAFPTGTDGTITYSAGPLPQAEPDGVYAPGTSAGTYIMCRVDDGTAYPVYVEDNVLTFPYLMATDVNGTLIKANETDQPNIKINVNQQP